jgi:hypothetical protein
MPFIIGWHLGSLRENFQLTDTLTRKPFERLLHDTILEGMEGDHTQSPLRCQCISRITERRLQMIQFLIDGDTERLKCPRRAMNAAPSIMTGHRRLNHLCQLVSAGQGLAAASAHDGPGNATGIAFFPQAVNHVG